MSCIVTAFYDIHRHQFPHFERNVEEYIRCFHHMLRWVNESIPIILYIEEKYISSICLRPNVSVIPITNKFLFEFTAFRWKERFENIQKSTLYQFLTRDRQRFPEVFSADYCMITNSKIDFIAHTSKTYPHSQYIWIDFGYFRSCPEDIGWQQKLPIFEHICIGTISRLWKTNSHIPLILTSAPENIVGGFFIVPHSQVNQLCASYHYVLEGFMSMNIMDDDQHVWLHVITCLREHMLILKTLDYFSIVNDVKNIRCYNYRLIINASSL